MDGVAEILQAGDETVGLAGFGSAVEVSGAKIVVELTADQHVISGSEDRGGKSPVRLLDAAAGAQAMELGLQIAQLLAGGGRNASSAQVIDRQTAAQPARSRRLVSF